MNKQRLIVIGNGMAGAKFLEELLARGGGAAFDITVFGDEPYGNYNRILLSGILAAKESPDNISLNTLGWYRENGIKLYSGIKAGWIDRLGKKVYAPGDIAEPYDKLVIAAGSVPFVPPIQGVYDGDGVLRSGVFTFRTLADCEAISAYSANVQKAAVVGGGLLGLEIADALLSRGLEVHVVHQAGRLMETQLDEQASVMLQSILEEKGFKVHLSQTASAVRGENGIQEIAFKDGSSLPCELIVIAAGSRPATDLAKQAGLSVQRGIVVTDDLSCRNDSNVFAIGDCAEHRGSVYGTVMPAWEQGRALADLLTGNEKARYRGSSISSKLKVTAVDLSFAGEKEAGPGDEVVSYVEPSRNVYKKLIIRDGKLAGAILLGDNEAAARVLQLFHSGETLPENRTEILFPLAGEGGAGSIADLPESAQICNCNGVSKGQIVAAINNGCHSVRAVGEATRAGTGCGSCKSQVEALLKATAGASVKKDPAEDYYVSGIPLDKPALLKAVREQNLRSVSAVFAALVGGKEDAASKPGLASLLKSVWGELYEDERDARFINDRVHSNIQKDGTFSVVPRIFGGVISAEELRRIADAVDKYNIPLIKITGGQRIALLGVEKEKLPDVWSDVGLPSGHAYTKAVRTCKTCVGEQFCRFGLGDSMSLGIRLEHYFQGWELPHKFKMGVTGCPRNCAESTTKDLGVVAVEGGKWEVSVGGAAGSTVRRTDVLCMADSPEEVIKYAGRFILYYQEHAKYQERSHSFVERVTISKLRQLLVEDAEGICKGLDEEAEIRSKAQSDPWEEGAMPVHASQFVSAFEG